MKTYQVTAINPAGAVVRRFNTDETGALNVARRAILAAGIRSEESSADLAALAVIAGLETAASWDVLAPNGARVGIRKTFEEN